MKDVAQEAGVALGTVSKVFNGLPVGDSYRQKVEDAARKLGYQVNNYARGLKTNQTYTVAVIVPSLTHPFFGMVVENLTRVLSERNYRTLLALTDYNPQTELRCIEMVRQNKVDGIIALTYNPGLSIEDNFPFVSLDRYYSSTIPCVASDNYGGGEIAAKKLTELGCRNLLFLRTGSSVPGEPDKRGAGFESWCSLNKVPHQSYRVTDDREQVLLRFLDSQISGGTLCHDGIFCSTDYLAALVCRHLTARGIRVPEDVQVIGFDGLKDYSTGKPLCSSIVQPVEEIAKAAVDILLTQDRSRLPALTCLPVHYRPGGTTKDTP